MPVTRTTGWTLPGFCGPSLHQVICSHSLWRDLAGQKVHLAEGRMGEGIVREFGIDMCTLLYLKWITNKDPLCSPGNPAQCYVAAWMGREFGGEWIHVCVWLGHSAAHLKLSQHCQSAISSSSSRMLVTQLCPTLYNPVDCGLPGSSVHGEAGKILKWVVIPFSRGSC